MSDKIKVACPNCQKRYAVPADMVGKKVKCGCGTKFRVSSGSSGGGTDALARPASDEPRDESDLLAEALAQQGGAPAAAPRRSRSSKQKQAGPPAGETGDDAFDPLAAPAAFDPLTAPSAVGGGGVGAVVAGAGQRMPLKTARTASGGDACPQCGVAVSPNAVICTECGYHLLTGETHRTRVGASEHGPLDDEVPWRGIAMAPFYGQVMGTAVFITIGAAGWYALFGVAIASMWIFYNNVGVWGVIPGLLGGTLIAIAGAGWILRGMAEMAAALESGTVSAESDRSLVSSMGHAFIVGLVSFTPQIVVWIVAAVAIGSFLYALATGADETAVAGGIGLTLLLLAFFNVLAQLWFVFYAPFAIAVDGAYHLINPVEVFGKMMTLAAPFFKTMGIALLYYIVLGGVIVVTTILLVMLGDFMNKQIPFVIFWAFAAVISATLITFGYTAHVAIVARMLRRYRDY